MTTTMKHFTEADLLETYYLQPGESMPVMMHLASCNDCAARYDRLERKLREAAVCNTEKPDTFWARQRISIMRKIATTAPAQSAPRRHFGALAAAALLAVTVGGFTAWQNTRPEPAPFVAEAPLAAIVLAEDVPADPWQSEDLRDLHSMVDWQSWSDTAAVNGRKSS